MLNQVWTYSDIEIQQCYSVWIYTDKGCSGMQPMGWVVVFWAEQKVLLTQFNSLKTMRSL